MQWSVGLRLIGFEKDKNSLGETQPRTCWVICDSVPVCVAIDRLRPCTPAELLAFHHTQTKNPSPLAADAQTQQGFIDERASFGVSVALQRGTCFATNSDELVRMLDHRDRGTKNRMAWDRWTSNCCENLRKAIQSGIRKQMKVDSMS